MINRRLPRGSRSLSTARPPHGAAAAAGFLIPAVALVSIVNLYPFLWGVLLAFQEGSLIKLEGWVGLENLAEVVADEDFWVAFRFTGLFTFAATAGSMLLGLAVALLLNRLQRGRQVQPRRQVRPSPRVRCRREPVTSLRLPAGRAPTSRCITG